MKWIKIDEGCKMPEEFRSVAILIHPSWWDRGFITSKGEWIAEGETVHPTHWARVELPEE